ncbi:hypothetical protein DNU06_06050 [Putridiphycobacter roseus]|uniref:DUF7033 domain-containing protein n=1 Tax=Putridiphycobacter roseus TaxID=2219161 RepID=A0A2W1N2T3_9FLAO|nr:polysaccharide deacetylase family protein [Putridiphycobacter roseus]PZE18174.1 hypothetical protein DNU06_06050 [Putridiphycobacter roseus]
MAKEVLIYCEKESNRLHYVLDFIFKSKGIQYALTQDQVLFAQSNLPRINYSNQKLAANITFTPSALLFEIGFTQKMDVLYAANKAQWFLNNVRDDFAFIFYQLSRYEEYTAPHKDAFGRFDSKAASLVQNKQIEKPWCDILVQSIWHKLGLDYSVVLSKYAEIPTFDIDIAWAYLNRKYWRTALSMLKELTHPKALKKRLRILNKQSKDPYDSYALMQKVLTQYQGYVFFLLGDYAPKDKNIHWKNKALSKLVNTINTTAKTGIHPSFASFLNQEKVAIEINRLKKISKAEVIHSRQHFLRLNLPKSYQILIALGIKHDFSMGYADQVGFRAGTAFVYPFFDLTSNKVTPLQIHPFCYMDGTLKEYLKLEEETAMQVISKLKKEVKAVGGNFTGIWHNHSIGNQMEWENWQKVFLHAFPT